MIEGWIYLASGEMVLDAEDTPPVLIARSLEWTARDKLGHYWWHDTRCRMRIEGEIGVVGRRRLVVSDEPNAIQDMRSLKAAIWPGIAASPTPA